MSTLRVRERLILADRCRFHRPGSDRLTVRLPGFRLVGDEFVLRGPNL
jgi:hypothetical protein